MDELGVDRSRVKTAGAYVLEKLGRLKANGQLPATPRSAG